MPIWPSSVSHASFIGLELKNCELSEFVEGNLAISEDRGDLWEWHGMW